VARLLYFSNCDKSNDKNENADNNISNISNGDGDDDDYSFQQMLGVCDMSLVLPGWPVCLMMMY